jgi:undecaprenyl-diphosphatase
MQEIIKAVILGIIQGLTEYLPVSSTAHLRIIPAFFGWKDIGAAYTAVIQVGTMIAIIIYFWKDQVRMFSSFFNSIRIKDFKTNRDTRLFMMIAAGTLPILVFGYLFKGFIRNQFRNIYIVAGMMIMFSFVMLIAEKYTRRNRNIENLNFKDALIVGLFQSIALIPGTSRSGSTISGSFFRHLGSHEAARFSFLLSIPAVLISGLYELYSEKAILFSNSESTLSLLVATIVSGLVGYWSIWFLLNYLKTHSLKLFIVYRIIFGILIIILLLTNFINN